MLLDKKVIILLCVIPLIIISVVGIMANQLVEEASLEKIGKIKNTTFIYPIPGDCCGMPMTYVDFEDGDRLEFWNILQNIEEGKTYRIVYQKQDRMCINDDPTFKACKISTVNVVQEIEEIFP